MRLVVGTLSAILLSGCSWFGGGYTSSGFTGGGSGYGCANNINASGGQYGYTNQYVGQGGCAGGYAYGQAAHAYGYAGTGAHGAYGGLPGGGLRGVQGGGAYGTNMGVAGIQAYGANGAAGMGAYNAYATGNSTMLGTAAPYGTAVGGANIAGANRAMTGGQFINGRAGYGATSGVTTIQGAPIYIPRPYPAYYGVPTPNMGCCGGGGYAGGGLRGGFAALPFGIEVGIGTEIAIGGDIFPGAPAKPAGTNFISAIAPIGYADAYKNAVNYELAGTYDVNPSTTLLGRVGYSSAQGQRLKIGTIDDGINPAEDLYAQWGDLEQVTLEGGVRKYVGGWNNTVSGIRPYIQATAGFTHNQNVNLVQDSAILAPAALNTQQYIQAGWTPTAAGLIGAEMQVGARTAIGVETGLRWRDDLNTNLVSGDRWSIPLRLRGRVSF